MAVAKVYDQTRNVVGNIMLDPEVFEVAVKPEILHLVVREAQARRRAGTHAVKGRSEVSGGGRKPWRQKGTGRARAGSIRSPLWRHGAVVFGPQPRDYSFKINKKIKAQAMRMAFSARLAENNLLVVRNIILSEIKTKGFFLVASALELKKALIVCDKEDKCLILSARNIPGITILTQNRVGVRDVLAHTQLVLFEGAARQIEDRLK
ncbi:50S ribosomal protein L4 [Desulfovibrionales bacterium]